ncbi:PilZ domain-containing protein [Thermodesulfobacteriota bacterium]
MEKRRGTRHKKRLMIRFGQTETKNLGFIEDISATGIRVKTKTVFKPSTKLQVEISLEDSDETMKAEGVVMWAKKVPPGMSHRVQSGMGITFLRIDTILHDFLLKLNYKINGSG